MFKSKVGIKGVAYYHPSTIVDNEYFLDYYRNKNQDISGLLKAMGRKKRYIADKDNENIITMGVSAVERLLKETGVNAKDIGLIVFSTGTPEHISPTNAIKLHHAIDGSNDACVYDTNANCVGMIVTFNQVCLAMNSDKDLKYALIVGSDNLSKYANYDEAITYSNFGDSACAILLENNVNRETGLIDMSNYTESINHDTINFPAKGLSNIIHNKRLAIQDKLIQWNPFDADQVIANGTKIIRKLLIKNKLDNKDIKRYFVSQLAKQTVKYVCDELHEDINKFEFVGDEFGYTGTTSPFLALARSLENKLLKQGDNVVFWSYGAGATFSCALYKY